MAAKFFNKISRPDGEQDCHEDIYNKIDLIEQCLENSSSVENILLSIGNLEVLAEKLH